ncbi:aminodeoxychorismate synthase component I [Lysobacter enzymogenes]|uniref:aminodeoxychorismate synthase component I n=1 Tax=Lysobacter enzymogenes TaxID=69 RepID=UPI00197C250C|nr:aminodeoxychorismate synthase component I [Lysobacter enzymogenes]
MDRLKVLLVDNYDSFTHNIAHYLGEANGEPPTVVANDALDWAGIEAGDYDAIVISPGPGRPERAADMGVSNEAIARAGVPVLGICLGHQALVHVFGGTIAHAPQPMHGRLSTVEHDGSALFAHIPSSFEVVRYHSLIAAEPLPAGLRVTARTADGLPMALEHVDRPLWGVQFHPESIHTEFGHQLINNFIELARQHTARKRRRRGGEAASAGEPAAPRAQARETWSIQSRRLTAPADPQALFLHAFAASDTAFWLDSSAIRPGYSRFSFIGDGREDGAQALVHRVGDAGADTVFERIRAGLNVDPRGGETLPFDFVGGWVGYFGYELKALTEVAGPHRARQPDLYLRFVRRFLAYDHLERCWHAVATGPLSAQADDGAWLERMAALLQATPEAPALAHGARAEPVEFQLELDREAYRGRIRQCFAQIGDGETYEVCLTNRLRARVDLDPVELYRHLRQVNPAPYSALLRHPGFDVLSSSPERFLRLSPNGVVEIKPIKGTRPRAGRDEDDRAIAAGLKRCEKDRAENLMIVDLTRNDLARVSEVGSVWVPKLMQIESYASVHQLVSTVRAQLSAGLDVVDLLQATFPGGSMTGAPKRRTLQIIDALEASARGIYSGAIGYLSLNGAADLSMVIRTLVHQDGSLELGVGGAVIALSDPDGEFEELLVKARAPMRAVARCASGDADAWRIPGETEPAPAASVALAHPRS